MFCPQSVLCRPMSEVTDFLLLLFTDYVIQAVFLLWQWREWLDLTGGGEVCEVWREKCSLAVVVMQGPRPHPCICVRLLKCTQEWVFWTLLSSQVCLGRLFCFINQVFFYTLLSILICILIATAAYSGKHNRICINEIKMWTFLVTSHSLLSALPNHGALQLGGP